MSDFLSEMARESRRRVPERKPDGPGTASSPIAPCRLDANDFLLIAEFKRISPAAGVLSAAADPAAALATQVAAYASGGASALSVLTEPSRFGGSLDDLCAAAKIARSARLPVMRKDFLVDPSQVHEARQCGASGVLLIARMLSDDALCGMTALSGRLGMFTLIEAFDEGELERAARAHDALGPVAGGKPLPPVLLGLNCRNLATLTIDAAVFERLSPAVRVMASRGLKVIAESGLRSVADVAQVARLGYAGALVGSSLMQADEPRAVCAQMLAAARAAMASKSIGATS